ncbi:class I SAM-dependent methyltransferase [Thiocapsa sp. UBA6158]|uniref:class I SAM-dependent methyltransferase n=1 Tax=Thiocapsa sp. UBA6158 TaxID=1947692 RepID=UPI002600D40C|nr:class I SAM-dependent methyltransferase [Thiocapsa sp. UBA6158]
MIRTRPQLHCELCGCPGKPLYTGLADRLFGASGEWNLSECSNPACGLMWLNPMPSEEDIGLAYLNYYTHDPRRTPLFERMLAWFLYTSLGLLAERRRADLMYLDRISPGRLLEVGFGDGRRLERLSAMGWTVEGQEVDPVAIRQARDRGLTTHQGALETIGLPGDCYDAVIANHVIEHIHDPVGLLAECRRLLKPGGRLILVTPNSNSYGHALFRESWLPLDPPRHLHLFSTATMIALLRRAGFRDPLIWTTMARAGTVFRGSHDLKLRQAHSVTAFPRVGTALLELKSLLMARIEQFRRSDAGEELVACAVKLHPGAISQA